MACEHTDKTYYAKGMCVNCYHRQGRTKKAWSCPHKSRIHYSKGLCKYCYLAEYYKTSSGNSIKQKRKNGLGAQSLEVPTKTESMLPVEVC